MQIFIFNLLYFFLHACLNYTCIKQKRDELINIYFLLFAYLHLYIFELLSMEHELFNEFSVINMLVNCIIVIIEHV